MALKPLFLILGMNQKRYLDMHERPGRWAYMYIHYPEMMKRWDKKYANQ